MCRQERIETLVDHCYEPWYSARHGYHIPVRVLHLYVHRYQTGSDHRVCT